VRGLRHGRFRELSDEVAELRRRNADLADQLCRSRQRFDLFFNHAPLGYLCLNRDGRILDVNEAWLDMFAMDRRNILGRSFDALLDQASRSVFAFHFGRLCMGVQLTAGRYTVLRGDGSLATMSMSATADMDQGRFRQGHCLFRDVTGMERRMRLLSLQRDLGTLLSAASSFAEAMEQVLDIVLGMEGIDCGGVFVRLPSGGYKLLRSRGVSEQYAARVAEFEPGSPPALLLDKGRAVYGAHDELRTDRHPTILNEKLRWMAVLPLRHRSQVIGAMFLATRNHDDMPQDLRHALQSVASQAGSAMAIYRSLDELRVSEARSQSILSAVQEGIIFHDAVQGPVLWNQSAERIMGAVEGRDGTTQLPKPVMLHPDGTQWPDSDHPSEVTLRTGRPVRGAIMRVLREDDSERWVSVSTSPLYRDPEADPYAVVISFRDVTESRRAEEALRHSEAMLRSLFQAAPMGIGVLRRGLVLGWTNGRLQAMFGYAPIELEGQYASRIFTDPNVLQRVGSSHYPLLKGEDHGSLEVRLEHRDGTSFDALVNTASLDPGDSESAVVFTVTDVTELKRVHQDLLQAKEAAESANKAKGVFLANMSHELRTPLSGMMGMLRLLRGEVQDRDQQEYVRTALATGKSLLAVINDILDFSKMEAGVLDLAHRPFLLGRCLEQVADNFRVLAREKGLVMTMDVDPSVPDAVSGDEARLRQVLFNLLGNAVKYTDQGGVNLEVCNVAAEDEDRVRLLVRVSDTGIGIPEEKVLAMFDAFRQGEDALSRRYQGAGLGLGIVKRLAGLMGGHLSVDSEPGRGTDIYLTMPLEQAETHPPREEAPAVEDLGREGGGLRILLAEDDVVNRTASKRFLEIMGHHCVCAENGRQALDMLVEEPFDCVLMDIQMPEMDGMEATRAIRAHDGCGFDPALPVIAMTAHAMKGDREHFMECGMDDYLAKPVDPDDLARTLERVRNRKNEA